MRNTASIKAPALFQYSAKDASTRRNLWRVMGILAIVLFLLLHGGAATRQARASGDAGAKIDRIRQAWRSRENRAKSFHFTWIDRKTIAKDGLGLERRYQPDIPQDSVIPPEDTILSNECELRIDVGRAIYHQRGQKWDPKKNQLMSYEYKLAAADGREQQILLKCTAPYPVADVHEFTGLARILAIETLLPLGLCYRLLDPNFEVFGKEVPRLSTSDMEVDGTRTDILSFMQPNGSRVDLWLDAVHEWMPFRHCYLDEQGTTLRDLKIKFKRGSSMELVPTEWTLLDVNADGSPRLTHHVTVRSFEFNEPATVEQFAIGMPDGTWVNDQRDQSRYILVNGGEKRYLTEDEGVEDYDRVTRGATKKWFWVILSVPFVLIATWLAAARLLRLRRMH